MSDPDDARMRELARRLVDMAPPAPPFPEGSMTQLTPRPSGPRRPAPVAWFAIGAVAVLLLIAVPLLLTGGGDETPVAVTTTTQGDTSTTNDPGTTTTTLDSTTTTTQGTITTSAPTAGGDGVDVSSADWVRTDGFESIVDSGGDQIIDTEVPLNGTKTVAWDTRSGIVLLEAGGAVRWVRPEGQSVIPLDLASDPVGLIDVAALDAGPAVALRLLDGTVAWIDLATAEVVPGDPALADFSEQLRDQIGAQGRKAWVSTPENADAERAEDGRLIWPYELPQAVVEDVDGQELARITLGSEAMPFVLLQDFDGRRVVVSTEAWEPALGERTIHIIDLECGTCTETFQVGSDSVDLVGVLESEGQVVADFDI